MISEIFIRFTCYYVLQSSSLLPNLNIPTEVFMCLAESNVTSKSEAEQKARIFYQSCMDVNKTIEKLGGAPVLNMIKVKQKYSGIQCE